MRDEVGTGTVAPARLERAIVDETTLAHRSVIAQSLVRHPSPRLPLQSSSASRFTAGAAGFLILSQWSTRPDRYGIPSRFDTMPSHPSAQAWRKMTKPSPAKCLFKAMPSRTPRSSSASKWHVAQVSAV